ncbi:MAG: hypothetical protein V2A76_05640 [Planctomycetota bacterium]
MPPKASRQKCPLLFLLLACALAPAARPASHPALERVAVIGASVTDGFLLPNEVHAMVTVADVIQASCVDPIEPPFRMSSMLFFRNPVEYGTRYARAAQEADPTLLIAVDFLFWFGYGFTMDEASRLQQLEAGLALLEPFECPVVVGDFPNMIVAAREGVGIHGAPMISEWQVPSEETLAQLNRRLKEWANERPHVHVVPMSDFLEKIRSGRQVEVHGNEWPENSQATLVDKDLLHTTFEGTVGLTLLALDTLVAGEPDLEETLFHWDKDVIKQRVLDARKEERAQRMRGVEEPSGG